jgi:uncharacterized protein YkwD
MWFDLCRWFPSLCSGPKPAPSPVPNPTPSPAPPSTSAERKILALTNQLRAQNSLSPLTWSDELAYAAVDWSHQQSRTGIISHMGFPWARTQTIKAHYPSSTVSVMGENVAMFTGGNGDPGQMLFDMWAHSPGHRANMLTARFTKLGVGVVGSGATFGTQIFGT